MSVNIVRQPSNVFGLKYIPSFENEQLNSIDHLDNEYLENIRKINPFPLYWSSLSFTPNNQKILLGCLQKCNPKNILEIGMGRDHPEFNSTKTILDNISIDSKYLGIDIYDMTKRHDINGNPFFIQTEKHHHVTINSYSQEIVRQELSKRNMLPLDFIFIDGDHSLNSFLNDWKYVDLLSPGGYVVFHDTTHHPGPREFFDAIDESLFDKAKYCLDDFGISYARLK